MTLTSNPMAATLSLACLAVVGFYICCLSSRRDLLLNAVERLMALLNQR